MMWNLHKQILPISVSSLGIVYGISDIVTFDVYEIIKVNIKIHAIVIIFDFN